MKVKVRVDFIGCFVRRKVKRISKDLFIAGKKPTDRILSVVGSLCNDDTNLNSKQTDKKLVLFEAVVAFPKNFDIVEPSKEENFLFRQKELLVLVPSR